MRTFKLENEPKIASGFNTPEQYFDDFSKKILLQLPHENEKIIPLFSNRLKWLWSVAAILIVGLLLPIYNQFTSTSEELDAATLENHLTYQIEINPYELISELDEENFNKIQPKVPLKNEIIEDILTKNPDLEVLISE
jgi:hypothetical protein